MARRIQRELVRQTVGSKQDFCEDLAIRQVDHKLLSFPNLPEPHIAFSLGNGAEQSQSCDWREDQKMPFSLR